MSPILQRRNSTPSTPPRRRPSFIPRSTSIPRVDRGRVHGRKVRRCAALDAVWLCGNIACRRLIDVSPWRRFRRQSSSRSRPRRPSRAPIPRESSLTGRPGPPQGGFRRGRGCRLALDQDREPVGSRNRWRLIGMRLGLEMDEWLERVG